MLRDCSQRYRGRLSNEDEPNAAILVAVERCWLDSRQASNKEAVQGGDKKPESVIAAKGGARRVIKSWLATAQKFGYRFGNTQVCDILSVHVIQVKLSSS
jgi:hypothetical protein